MAGTADNLSKPGSTEVVVARCMEARGYTLTDE